MFAAAREQVIMLPPGSGYRDDELLSRSHRTSRPTVEADPMRSKGGGSPRREAASLLPCREPTDNAHAPCALCALS
jgi:hypothetical protein